MSISQNQRRRGRSGSPGVAAGRESTSGSGSGTDALAGLRDAVVDLDPGAFARCFSNDGWVRVPRPEGDVVLYGPAEIEQLGHELRVLLVDLNWTPSQRFVAAGQVVEEAVARARTAAAADGESTEGSEIRIPMRVVAALDPAGGIGSLTLWVDWAALNDPHGVASAHGAASALIAQARARDSRGLRVIESEPGAAPLPRPIVPVPAPRGPTQSRPPAAVLWWKQHRATLAGSAMALAAAAVISWVAVSTLGPVLDGQRSANQAGPTVDAAVRGAETEATGGPGDRQAGAAPTTTKRPAASKPVIVREEPQGKPTVQAGERVTIQSDVLFRTNSTDLTAKAREKLQMLAQRVQAEQRDGTIQINGYTDAVGSERDNLKLARDRAKAVAEALRIEFTSLNGVVVRLAPQGFGEAEPVASNLTAAGREMNRRVTIVLPFGKKG